jgi:hypothetical protein
MTLSTQGSDGFVASAAAWIATGWKTTKLAGWDLHPLKNHTFSRRTPRIVGFALIRAASLRVRASLRKPFDSRLNDN